MCVCVYTNTCMHIYVILQVPWTSLAMFYYSLMSVWSENHIPTLLKNVKYTHWTLLLLWAGDSPFHGLSITFPLFCVRLAGFLTVQQPVISGCRNWAWIESMYYLRNTQTLQIHSTHLSELKVCSIQCVQLTVDGLCRVFAQYICRSADMSWRY